MQTKNIIASIFDHDLGWAIPEGHILCEVVYATAAEEAEAEEEGYLDRNDRMATIVTGPRDEVFAAWAVMGGATFTPAVAS